MVEITFKIKKPDNWGWLKDDYFKRFEKDQELRDRVSKLVRNYIRDTIRESEEETNEKLEEELEEEE
ncbi:MAG: hypothetical protein DRN83_03650 [Hadesarchaea archaeon]|nr:MAG: hypothetical protein DRN83_03650 [Hadesarchaea archaeon]